MPPQVQPVLGHLQQRIQALRFESLRKNCLQFEFRRFGLPKANTRQIVARFNRAIESRRMAVRLSEAKQGNKRQQQPLSNPPPPHNSSADVANSNVGRRMQYLRYLMIGSGGTATNQSSANFSSRRHQPHGMFFLPAPIGAGNPDGNDPF